MPTVSIVDEEAARRVETSGGVSATFDASPVGGAISSKVSPCAACAVEWAFGAAIDSVLTSVLEVISGSASISSGPAFLSWSTLEEGFDLGEFSDRESSFEPKSLPVTEFPSPAKSSSSSSLPISKIPSSSSPFALSPVLKPAKLPLFGLIEATAPACLSILPEISLLFLAILPPSFLALLAASVPVGAFRTSEDDLGVLGVDLGVLDSAGASTDESSLLEASRVCVCDCLSSSHLASCSNSLPPEGTLCMLGNACLILNSVFLQILADIFDVARAISSIFDCR
mmetsp:Transcript_69529/g.110208  ORF Transcript_69529/g.110208 Transcript_69529/m.110208 type:complete len:284 (-) Transcript_69529:179-1030(-)